MARYHEERLNNFGILPMGRQKHYQNNLTKFPEINDFLFIFAWL